MKKRLRNLKLMLSSRPSLISGVLIAGVFWIMIDYFSDRALIAWNYGTTYGTVNIIFDVISALFIWFFVASFVYKTFTFRTIEKENSFWRIGWFFVALVGGCGSCSLTLATYLWLASFLTFMPRGWLELKILWALILWWAVRKNINTLLECKMKKSKKEIISE